MNTTISSLVGEVYLEVSTVMSDSSQRGDLFIFIYC